MQSFIGRQFPQQFMCWVGLTLALTVPAELFGQVKSTSNKLVPLPVTTVSAQLSAGNLEAPQEGAADTNNGSSSRLQEPIPGSRIESERSRIQSGLPAELILPPPSQQAKSRAQRFIAEEIDPELQLSLVTGRPKILRLAGVPTKVYAPRNDIFTIERAGENSVRDLAVTGLRSGTSTLTMWFDDPTAPSGQTVLSYLVRVFDDPAFARPIEEVARDINQKFPNSFVELDELGERLLVRGQARDSIEMAQILQILIGARGVRAGIQRIGRGETVSNSLNFVDQSDPLATETAIAESRREIDPVALAQAGIVNLMRVPGEQQVSLRVTVAQVNRSAARSIGLNFDIQNRDETVFGQFSGGLLTGGGGAAGGGASAANLIGLLDAGQITLAIDALRNLSLAKTLAEPNLVALNGQTANFQSGGSFPIPVIGSGGVGGGTNLQGVSFVPFGVQLQFTPLIRDRDVIRLQIDADISALDASVGTSIGGGGGGTSVSGISNQAFQTTVELRSGQTLAVAGLIESSLAAASERVPWLGDLPLLGNALGTRDVTSTETELVILVTPELVAPLGEHHQPSLPGDDIYEPSDIEFYLANRLESRRARNHRSAVRTDCDRQKSGEFCDVEQFLIGAVGPTDRCGATVSPAQKLLPKEPLSSNNSSVQSSPAPSVGARVRLGDDAAKGSNRKWSR